MGTRALRFLCLCFIATISVVLLGCGSGHRVICGTCCEACPADFTPLLYATTSSNQILGFTINRNSGALTAIPAATGPTNSQSLAIDSNNLIFADTSTNAVDSVDVDLVSGAFMAIQGSPFSLGTSNGGPTSIAVGPSGYLYATEPNGTIVGLGTGSELGSFATPLAGSPYPAGVAPAQIAFGGSNSTNFLYASDPGDATGGILAYSIDSTGALTPVNGSPFPTLAGAKPSFVLSGNYMTSQSVQGAGFLFVSLTGAAKVAVFAIDSNTGALTAVPGSPFLAGNGPGTLLEDEFNHLFVMNATDHTVSAFNLASNGVLTAIGTPMLVGTASGGMAYFPENQQSQQSQLYVADPEGNEIWILNVDQTTGMLTEPGPPLLVAPDSPLQLSVFTL